MAAAMLFASPLLYVPDNRPNTLTPGAPLVGAKLYVYTTGTSTPQAVYTDVDLSIPWTQPIVTNDAGESDGSIFVTQTPALKIAITDADDVMLPGYPVDFWSPYALGS